VISFGLRIKSLTTGFGPGTRPLKTASGYKVAVKLLGGSDVAHLNVCLRASADRFIKKRLTEEGTQMGFGMGTVTAKKREKSLAGGWQVSVRE